MVSLLMSERSFLISLLKLSPYKVTWVFFKMLPSHYSYQQEWFMTTAVVDQTKDRSNLALWFQPWPAAVSCLAKRKVTDQMLWATSLGLIPTLHQHHVCFIFFSDSVSLKLTFSWIPSVKRLYKKLPQNK